MAAVIARAAAEGRRVRATGSGHSHSPLIPTDDVIVDVSGLSGVIDVDVDARRATVFGGSGIHALGRPLLEHGLALGNQGDIDRQTIAGACGTGTHGTGLSLRNLSASVAGGRVAMANGDLVDIDLNSEWFPVLQLNLGGLGVVTRLDLDLRPAYVLQETGWSAPYDDLRAEFDDRFANHRHFEFFWFPRTDVAAAKTMDEVDEPAHYPVGAEGQRRAWSHEVLPNHRPVLHTEMEFSVPYERGGECLDEIRQLLLTEFTDVEWPVEYRAIAADEVWMSTAYGQPMVSISVHEAIDKDDGPYFRACEAIFRRYEGKPHWGKAHFFDGDDMARAHERYADWWAVRESADPSGTFLNDHLESLRPA